MSDKPKRIQPKTVFVRFIPDNTQAEELIPFFAQCGNIEVVTLIPQKNIKEKSSIFHERTLYFCGFVRFETQEDADQAIDKLSHKIFVNKKGIAGVLTVFPAYEKETIAELKTNKIDNYKEKLKLPSNYDVNELWQKYQANEEKLKQIYHDPAMDQELSDLTVTVNQLQAKSDGLKSKLQEISGESEILRLKLKLQDLTTAQKKLKGQN